MCFVTWVDLNNLLIMVYSFKLNDTVPTAEVARWPLTNVWSRLSHICSGFGVKVTFGAYIFLKYVPIYWYWLVLHPGRLTKKCLFRINSLKFEAWSLGETSAKIATVDGGKMKMTESDRDMFYDIAGKPETSGSRARNPNHCTQSRASIRNPELDLVHLKFCESVQCQNIGW